MLLTGFTHQETTSDEQEPRLPVAGIGGALLRLGVSQIDSEGFSWQPWRPLWGIDLWRFWGALRATPPSPTRFERLGQLPCLHVLQ